MRYSPSASFPSTNLLTFCFAVYSFRASKPIKRQSKLVERSNRRISRSPQNPSFTRFYCNVTEPIAEESAPASIDLLKPDYGLEGVTLDTAKYEGLFGDKKWFDRPTELVWNLWSPPNTVVRNDEWEALFKTVGAGSEVQDREFKIQRALLLPARLSNPLEFYRGYMQAFRSISEYINEGDVEALRGAMSTPCFNYVRAWTQYLKDLNYTMEYKRDSFERIERAGMSVLLVGDVLEEKKFVGPYSENAHFSRLGRGDCSTVSVMHWVKYQTVEEWSIKDAKGNVVSSSGPKKLATRFLKFNSSARVAGVLFDAIYHEAKKGTIGNSKEAFDHLGRTFTADEILNEQWQAKLCDIDNQVAMRAQDILYGDKVFYSPDSEQSLVWASTKAF